MSVFNCLNFGVWLMTLFMDVGEDMVPMGTDRLNAREKKMGSRLGEGEKQQLKKDREKGGRGRKGVP